MPNALFHDNSEGSLNGDRSDISSPSPPPRQAAGVSEQSNAAPTKARKRVRRKKEQTTVPDGLFQDWFGTNETDKNLDSSPSSARPRKRKKRTEDASSQSGDDRQLFDSFELPNEPMEVDEELQRRKEEFLVKLAHAEAKRKVVSKYAELAILRNTLILLSRALPLWTRRGMAPLPDSTEDCPEVDWPIEVRCGRVFDLSGTLNRLWDDCLGLRNQQPIASDRVVCVSDREVAERINLLEQEIAKRRDAGKQWTLPQFAGEGTMAHQIAQKLASVCEPASFNLPSYFDVTEPHILETQRMIERYYPGEDFATLITSDSVGVDVSGVVEPESSLPADDEPSVDSDIENSSQSIPSRPLSFNDDCKSDNQQESADYPQSQNADVGNTSDAHYKHVDVESICNSGQSAELEPAPSAELTAEELARRRRRASKLKEKMRRELLSGNLNRPNKSTFIEDAAEESNEDGSEQSDSKDKESSLADAEEVLEMFEFDEAAIQAEQGDEGAVKALLRQQMEERDSALYEKLFRKLDRTVGDADDAFDGRQNIVKRNLAQREAASIKLHALRTTKVKESVAAASEFEEKLSDLEADVSDSGDEFDDENTITANAIITPPSPEAIDHRENDKKSRKNQKRKESCAVVGSSRDSVVGMSSSILTRILNAD